MSSVKTGVGRQDRDHVHAGRADDGGPGDGSAAYLLGGQDSELERLQLQSRVWEPSGRRLPEEIGDGRGARALDVGCGVLGWLRVLSEWVGPDGEVTGTDIQDSMLAGADRFVTDEGLRNVGLVKDDLCASQLEPDSFDLVHARYQICPLGRGHGQMETYLRLARPGATIVLEDPDTASWHFNPPAPGLEADRADRGGVSAERGRLAGGAKAPRAASRVRHRRRARGGRASRARPLGHDVHAPAVLGPVPGLDPRSRGAGSDD